MSRVGLKAVVLPKGVEIVIKGDEVLVKGPKGSLTKKFNPLIEIVQEKDKLLVRPRESSAKNKGALWGTTRSLLSNMVKGVVSGFSKGLSFSGVGYRALVKGDVLNLSLGYSHVIDHKLSKGVKAEVKENTIILNGIDKELVGFEAARIREYRPPEPYKGKGIKYLDEVIIRKAGKSSVKK